MSYDTLRTETAPNDRDPGGFVLYDEHTKEAVYCLPCWRCGRNIQVNESTYYDQSVITCTMCARETREQTGLCQ